MRNERKDEHAHSAHQALSGIILVEGKQLWVNAIYCKFKSKCQNKPPNQKYTD